MQKTIFWLIALLLSISFVSVAVAVTAEKPAATATNTQPSYPILLYHKLAATPRDSMTITTANFVKQMQWLQDNHYTVVPLRSVVNYLMGQGPPPPRNSVVITIDDGHISDYTEFFPLIKKYKYPVTLFIYPTAISNKNSKSTLTWDELLEMQKTGLFTIEDHTYWHPNFKHEKKNLSPEAYQKFVDNQLINSKAILEKKLNIKVDLLAWPYGIYNPQLEQAARKAGYTAAFSIDARHASKSFNMMAQPRYMIINSFSPGMFTAIVKGHAQGKG